jgi:hypothetical protein
MLLVLPSSLQSLVSLSSERATSRRLLPRTASARANASPIPDDAPVMRVVFIPIEVLSGTTENSPAIYRWGQDTVENASPIRDDRISRASKFRMEFRSSQETQLAHP